jgi:hypothetical protein
MAGFAATLAAQEAAPKIQTLIITGQNRHDWRATTPVLRQMLQDTGRFDVRVVEEFRGAGPEMLAPYDLVILHYDSAGKPELRWGERAETALLNYVRSGKGLVIYHFAIASFLGWDEYEKLCGGNWRPNQGHHSPKQDFEVKIKDSSHPITKGLPAVMPQKADELYANLKWQPADKIHVLATAWDDHSKYGGKARQPIPGPGLDQPMLWTVDYGGGRIFVTALGHDVPAIQTPAFMETFRRGAEWAATGTVK